MKTYLLTNTLIFFALSAYCQSPATFKNDTATYSGRTFAAGDTVRLGYGSKSDKFFAFITMGNTLGGFNDCDKAFARYDAIVQTIGKAGNTISMKCKIISPKGGVLPMVKLIIDLEGAIDNKELKL